MPRRREHLALFRKLDDWSKLKGSHNYAQNLILGLTTMMSEDSAIEYFKTINVENSIPLEQAFTRADFITAWRALEEDKANNGFYLSSYLKIMSIGLNHLDKLEKENKKAVFKKAIKALDKISDQSKTFTLFIHFWTSSCKYYLDSVTFKHQSVDISKNNCSSLLNKQNGIIKKYRNALSTESELFLPPISDEAFLDIGDVIKKQFKCDKYTSLSDEYFTVQLKKLITHYQINELEIERIKRSQPLKSINHNLLRNYDLKARTANFIIAFHQLNKQKQFLVEWDNNITLESFENTYQTSKSINLLNLYAEQVDIFDKKIDPKNNRYPLIPSVVTNLLFPIINQLDQTFQPPKPSDNRRKNACYELFKLNVLRGGVAGNRCTIIGESRRTIIEEGERKNIDPRYWFEMTLSEYLSIARSKLLPSNSKCDVSEVIKLVFNYQGAIYSNYWVSFLNIIRDRAVKRNTPEHLKQFNTLLIKDFDTNYDAACDICGQNMFTTHNRNNAYYDDLKEMMSW